MPVPPIPVEFTTGSSACKITCDLGGVDVSSGLALVALIKIKTGSSNWHSILEVVQTGPLDLCSIEVGDSDQLIGTRNGLGLSPSESTVMTENYWAICAMTKAAGTTTPRLHLYDYNVASWVHTDYESGNITDPSGTETAIQIGEYENTDDANMYGAAWAIWNDSLSDANIETLTGSLNAWIALSPSWMVVANGDTPMVDEIGSGDETAREANVTDAPGEMSPLQWAAHTKLLSRPIFRSRGG